MYIFIIIYMNVDRKKVNVKELYFKTMSMIFYL
jgi:hypothetical protein